VVVTRGLLKLMDSRELEGVLAHELSHIANHDTRLNTIVASIALFLRLPYLLRKRQQRNAGPNDWNPFYRRFQMYRLALSPLYLYIFFIAPAMASVIRAAISRGREFLADADAALLTRYPEGLMRALAKIRGAGSVLAATNPVVSHFYFGDPAPAGFNIGMFSGNLLATHPPIDQRIIRLMEFNGGVPSSAIEQALKAGQQYTKDRPSISQNDFAVASSSDELSVLTVGNTMGRVCRVTGLSSPLPLYDRPDPRSSVLRKIKDGDLLVVFDDPGKYRQVITADQTFGYIPYSVKLKKVDMFPNEVFAMKTAPFQTETDASTPASTAAPSPALPPEPASSVTAIAAAPEPIKAAGLTSKQLTIAAVLFVGVFAAMFLVLMKFGS
jgi:hypothetical protein